LRSPGSRQCDIDETQNTPYETRSSVLTECKNAQSQSFCFGEIDKYSEGFSEILCNLSIVVAAKAGYTVGSDTVNVKDEFTVALQSLLGSKLCAVPQRWFSPLVLPFPPSSTRHHPAQ
jgi:hypothetical protein